VHRAPVNYHSTLVQRSLLIALVYFCSIFAGIIFADQSNAQILSQLKSENDNLQKQYELLLKEVQNLDNKLLDYQLNLRICILAEFQIEFEPLMEKEQIALKNLSVFRTKIFSFKAKLEEYRVNNIEIYLVKAETETRKYNSEAYKQLYYQRYYGALKGQYLDRIKSEVIHYLSQYLREIKLHITIHVRYIELCKTGELNNREKAKVVLLNLKTIVDGFLVRQKVLKMYFL